MRDRVALITGASRGIGAAVVRELAAHEARLVLVARDLEQLRLLGADLTPAPTLIASDLAAPDGVARVLDVLGQTVPDVVVSNAGSFALGTVGELPLDAAHRMFDLNLRAAYDLLHRLVPAMRTRGTGHIVVVGSVADHLVFPENAAYAASKHAVRAMTEVLRTELRGTGVRVTLISPGPVDTGMWDPIRPETRPGFPARAAMLRPEDVAGAITWCVTRPEHVNVDLVRLGTT